MCLECGHPFDIVEWQKYWIDERQSEKTIIKKDDDLSKYGRCKECGKAFTAYSKIKFGCHDYCYSEHSECSSCDISYDTENHYQKVYATFSALFKRFHRLNNIEKLNIGSKYYQFKGDIFFKVVLLFSKAYWKINFIDTNFQMLFKKRIGKYPLIKKLGEGKCAVCYYSETAEKVPVVVKYAKKWWFYAKNTHLREAYILSKIDHPAIPKLIEVLNDKSIESFVKEYKPGNTIRKMVFNENKKFSYNETINLFEKVLSILKYIHDNNIIFYDLRPDNIILNGDKINFIDFGSSRYARENKNDYIWDYLYLGDLLLFFLYSNYNGNSKGTWTEQLGLNLSQITFIKKLFLILPPHNSITEIQNEFRKLFPVKQDNPLKTIIAKVTNNCNLQCKYCSVGDVNDVDFMSDETLLNLHTKASKWSEIDETAIIWHGGEPLLAGIDFFKKILEIQKLIPNHKFINSIQTNGTLLDGTLRKFLKTNHFKLGLSLDGIEITHDLNRPYKNGNSSFQDTLLWIKRKKRRHACCVLNKNTYSHIEQIYEFSKKNTINFKFLPQYRAGRASDDTNLELSNDELASAFIRLFDLWFEDKPNERANIHLFDYLTSRLNKTKNESEVIPHYDCSFQNDCQYRFLGVAPNGDLYPCGKFVGEKEYLYGNINEEGEISEKLNNPMRENFLERHKGLKECELCKYKDFCNSGCSHTAFVTCGSIMRKHPACGAYKKLFEHIEKKM